MHDSKYAVITNTSNLIPVSFSHPPTQDRSKIYENKILRTQHINGFHLVEKH